MLVGSLGLERGDGGGPASFLASQRSSSSLTAVNRFACPLVFTGATVPDGSHFTASLDPVSLGAEVPPGGLFPPVQLAYDGKGEQGSIYSVPLTFHTSAALLELSLTVRRTACRTHAGLRLGCLGSAG